MSYALKVIDPPMLAMLALVFLACGASGPRANDASPDAGSSPDAAIDSTAAADGPFVISDATDSTPIDASVADGAVSEATSGDAPAVDGAGAYVDPLGGAVGCPDGGFPTSRGACVLNMSAAGSPAPISSDFCSNSGSASSLLWGNQGDAPNVSINFAAPIVRGELGAPDQPASVTFYTVSAVGHDVTWTTPSGACTVTLDSNVCWFDEGNTYYLVSGRGSCSAPAYADTDAGAITVGDFSFANVIYP